MDAFTPQTVLAAYLDCRKRKRGTLNAIAFEQHLSSNLVSLTKSLNDGSYYPGSSICFVVRNPKPREVFAADFRDRIVHHLLVRKLEQYWEKVFIYDSYACRKGKGTLAAVDRLAHFIRSITRNGSRQAYFLQCDIKSFFMSIDKEILWKLLVKGLERQSGKEEPKAFRDLLRKVLMHCPTTDFKNKSSEKLWAKVPPEKSLFFAPDGKGLPIGNLTSQFFANVYMNVLDQFVKHVLKVKYYIRYVDDFILLSEDLQQLKTWLERIKIFLQEELKLNLKQISKVASLSSGINFLGYIQHVHYRLVRRRVTFTFRRTLRRVKNKYVCNNVTGKTRRMTWSTLIRTRSVLCSYLAYISHANGKRGFKAALSRHRSWVNRYFTISSIKAAIYPKLILKRKFEILDTYNLSFST